MLRLVEGPPESPGRGEGTDTHSLIRAATLALLDVRDVPDDHLEKMFATAFRMGVRQGGCTNAEARRLRVAGEGESPSRGLEERLDTLDSALEAYVEATKCDPWEETDTNFLRDVFDLTLAELRNHRGRVTTARINCEVELYLERWNESDLPHEPELDHFARRQLVDQGVWMREQVRAMSDNELLALKGIGPKRFQQIREAV